MGQFAVALDASMRDIGFVGMPTNLIGGKQQTEDVMKRHHPNTDPEPETREIDCRSLAGDMEVFVNRWCSLFGHRATALAELQILIARVQAGGYRDTTRGGSMNMPDITDERRLSWWVRTRVKQPPDTPTLLALEAGCDVLVVLEGIAEAQRLLDAVQPSLDAGLIEPDDTGGFRLTAKGRQLPPRTSPQMVGRRRGRRAPGRT